MDSQTKVTALTVQLELGDCEIQRLKDSLEALRVNGAGVESGHQRTDYLPLLHKRMAYDYSASDQIASDLCDTAGTIISSNELLGYYATALQQSNTAADTEVQKELFCTQLSEMVAKVTGLTRNVDTNIKIINRPADNRPLKDAADGLNSNAQRLIKLNADTAERVLALESQRKTINDAASALAAKGVGESSRDALNNIEKLKSLNMAMPEIEMVKLAVEQTKKILSHAAGTVKFLHLIEASTDLTKQMNKAQDTVRDNEKTLRTRKIQLDYLTHVTLFEQQRLQYVAEVQLFIQPIKSWLQTLKGFAADESARYFFQTYQQMEDYVEPVTEL